MQLAIDVRQVDWWFWSVTLVLIAAAILGFTPGYGAVIAVSAAQVAWFAWRERSLAAFPTQVRIAYLAVALLGLWPAVRIWVYALLFIGTLMVTLFDRCAIALVLKRMPWNRDVSPQCRIP